VKAQKRERARLALKKKKLHENQAMQLDKTILKLDEQVVVLETTAHQVDTVSALRVANQAMKAMQKQMPLESIEKLMQENAEASVYVVR
jgi:charged multivesicular body protein 6